VAEAPPRFTVTDRKEPQRLIDGDIKARAQAVARDAASFTPTGATGRLKAGWRVVKGTKRDGLWRVTNYVPYSVYVEYGTRRADGSVIPPVAMLGRAVARQERR
jgi:hypothetical protein